MVESRQRALNGAKGALEVGVVIAGRRVDKRVVIAAHLSIIPALAGHRRFHPWTADCAGPVVGEPFFG